MFTYLGVIMVCSDAKQTVRFLLRFDLLLPKPTWPKENPTHLWAFADYMF